MKKVGNGNKWHHPDAREAMLDFFSTSKEKFESVLKETEKKCSNMTQDKQPAQDPDSVERAEVAASNTTTEVLKNFVEESHDDALPNQAGDEDDTDEDI